MNYDLKNATLAVGCSVGLGLALYFGYKKLHCRRKMPYIGGAVSKLHLFPVKSLAGCELDSLEFGEYGPLFDRNWVLVNAKGLFQCRAIFPKMVLIQPSFEGNEYLCLDAPGMTTMKVKIDLEDDESQRMMIDILDVSVEGQYCGDEVSQWFDTYLEKTGLRLYTGRNRGLKKRQLKDHPIWSGFAKDGDEAMFANDSPVMLLSEASIVEVNGKIGQPCSELSFRPNILVSGCRAHEEQSWNTVMIGDVLLRKLRETPRCSQVNVDYTIGKRRPDNEPLKTIKRDNKCRPGDERYNGVGVFGVFYAVDKIGTVNVGDDVIVIN